MASSVPFTSLVCENIIPLGSSSVCSEHDLAEVRLAATRIAKEYEIGLRGSPAFMKQIVSFVFPADIGTTSFSVRDVGNGEVFQTFDCKSISANLKLVLKENRHLFVFTYPNENRLSPSDTACGSPVTSKPQFLCFVYQCSSAFEISRIYSCVLRICQQAKTPLMVPSVPHWNTSTTSIINPTEYVTSLRLHIDIREEDSRCSPVSTPVPKEKPNLFKLRVNLEKTIVVGVSQHGDLPEGLFLRVAKCLGIGLSFGRFVSDADMASQVSVPAKLSTDEANSLIPGASFVAKIPWSPKKLQFKLLNTVTDRDRFVFFTVVCHLVLEMFTEAISLKCVCRAKVFREDESFWLPPDRRPCTEDVSLRFAEFLDAKESCVVMNRFVVVNLSSPFSDVMRSLTSSTSPSACAPGTGESPNEDDHRSAVISKDEDSFPAVDDDDEPLMSGNGFINGDVTDDQLSLAWAALISEWRANLSTAPPGTPLPTPPSADEALRLEGAGLRTNAALGKRIRQLVRRGIPDALRPETWQMLAGYQNADPGLMEAYRILITRPCRFDMDIQRDLPRTFPAHDFFRDQQGQQILFALTRAIALYDEEVGYCQGISFIAAALLLYLPEEQAFCLLVKLMSNYGTRLLFMQNCDGLFRCLYQFERLLQDQLPDVAKAFDDLGIKSHMYASQWLLTLFMTKFPLNLVFRILDIFLCDGLIFIFKVMISLLKVSRRDLLGLDFEGTLKYFRVSLPKRFRSPEACNELILMASSSKVASPRLIRYGKDWEKTKSEEADLASPLRALQREVWQLRDQCARLEKENDVLAAEVLTHKSVMQTQIDKLEDTLETMKSEHLVVESELAEKSEQCELLEKEMAQVKGMFRTTLEQHESECQSHLSIIQEYKTITSNLSKRLDRADTNSTPGLPEIFIDAVMTCTGGSGECRQVLDANVPGWYTNDFTPLAGDSHKSELSPDGCNHIEARVAALTSRIRDLELELAHNKVHLVDEQCRRQELSYQLLRITSELEESRASNSATASSAYNPRQWLAKKLTATRSTPSSNTATTIIGTNEDD